MRNRKCNCNAIFHRNESLKTTLRHFSLLDDEKIRQPSKFIISKLYTIIPMVELHTLTWVSFPIRFFVIPTTRFIIPTFILGPAPAHFQRFNFSFGKTANRDIFRLISSFPYYTIMAPSFTTNIYIFFNISGIFSLSRATMPLYLHGHSYL